MANNGCGGGLGHPDVDSADGHEGEHVDARPYRSPGSPVVLPDSPEGDTNNALFFSTLTEKDEESYDLSEGLRLCIVLNHKNFDPRSDLGERRGTDVDCVAIENTFVKMGFAVRIFNDLTFDRIQSCLGQLQENRVELSCLALFILTHGEENGVLYAYDTPFRLDKHVTPKLLPDQCPCLAGKPKLIFIQACQGKKTDAGADITVRPRSRHTSTDGDMLPSNSYRIPHYADLLIFQAAYHGFYSFRSGRSGSWFIQALCQAFEKALPEEEIMLPLTRAMRYVSLYKESHVPQSELDGKRQIPLLSSTLIRSMYLKKDFGDAVDRPQAGVVVRTPADEAPGGYDTMASQLAAQLNDLRNPSAEANKTNGSNKKKKVNKCEFM